MQPIAESANPNPNPNPDPNPNPNPKQSLFPPALETLHQPATYHHLHTVVDSTMAVTPRRTLTAARTPHAAAWAHSVTAGNAWW